MMDWLQVTVLALVQGLTEFLPISSSAHLILVPQLLQWPDQGPAFDIAVHLGTLIAVLCYFRKLWFPMLKHVSRTENIHYTHLWWSIVVATVPVGLLGLLGKSFIQTQLRSGIVIAWSTIGFGLLLGLADYIGKRNRPLKYIHFLDAVVIGVAQAISLIPGTSRSGITLTAGLLRGFDRYSAAAFSFLLSIPVIILAGGLELFHIVRDQQAVEWVSFAIGMCVSGISGYLCIEIFLKMIDRIGMMPFVVYRLILGLVLLYYF